MPGKAKPVGRAGMPTEQVYVPDRASWRQWLEDNHAVSSGIWLVFDKKSSRTDRLLYSDSVEEALCYGWIDSTIRPLDDARYMQLFTPRKPKSNWSRLNKERVARLQKADLIRPAGASAIAEAKKNGSWSKLDTVEALSVPDDLAKELAKSAIALKNFNAFAPSARKGFLHWVHNCKRPETRAERIRTVVRCAKENRKFRDAPAPRKPAK